MSSTDQTVSGAATLAAPENGPGSDPGPTTGERAPPPRQPRQGEKIGGFVVLGKLGAGGMAVVFRAFDPDLERMVALKLHGGFGSTESTARIMREARSMARLTHPNVLTVYEVGTHGDDVFIAMELAAGGTLRDWIKKSKPPWREVVTRFVAAGRGLAAAHELGIVHRDFKADNVLLDADGRPRVADFGLAREQDAALEPHKVDLTTSSLERLTDAGAALGTPLYMPPEQYGIGKITAASDQFAFCASLYEALYGRSPFTGDTLGARLQHIVDGDIVDPSRTEVPRRILVALRRGLAADPSQRFEDMPALLRELTRDTGASRRRVAGALGVAAIAIGGAYIGARTSTVDPCQAARAEITATWNEDRRATVAAAIARAAEPVAVAGVLAPLDDFAAGWTERRIDTCEATHVRAEQSTTVLEQRMACLDRGHATFEGVIRALETAEPATLSKAPEIVAQLSDVQACDDPSQALDAVPPPPPERAGEVAELQAEKAAIDSLASAKSFKNLQPRIEALRARVDAVGYEPLRLEVRYVEAQAAESLGHFEDARNAFEDVMDGAVRAGRDEFAARATAKLAFIVGFRFRDLEGAERLLRLARATESRRESARARKLIEAVASTLAHERGDDEAAVAAAKEALDLASELDPEPSHVAADRMHYGIMLDEAGRTEEALAAFRQAVTDVEEEYGREDGRVRAPLRALAVHYAQSGDMPRAAELFARGVALAEASHGAQSLDFVEALRDLAMAQLNPSQHGKAKRNVDRALAVLAGLPEDHAALEVQLHQIAAEIAAHEDDCDAAREIHARMEALVGDGAFQMAAHGRLMCAARVEGPEHAIALADRMLASAAAEPAGQTAFEWKVLLALASAIAADSPERALEAAGRATTILNALGTPAEGARLALALAQARSQRVLGRSAAATESLGHAVELADGPAPDGGWPARSLFDLAQQCGEDPAHRSRARSIADHAAQAARDEDDVELARTIEAWRDRHAVRSGGDEH